MPHIGLPPPPTKVITFSIVGSNLSFLLSGLTIEVRLFEELDHMPVHTDDETFYNEDDLRDFGHVSKEYNGCTKIVTLDDLKT